jgi:hypothetical protein
MGRAAPATHRDGRSLDAAWHPLHVACCLLSVAYRLLHLRSACSRHRCSRTHARTRARARAHAFVGTALAHKAFGRKASVAPLVSQCRAYMLCTAAAPCPSLQISACLQLAQIAVDGTAAEKALLADVTAKHPDASYIDLLRLFKVRCRMGTRSVRLIWCMLHRACSALPSHICSQLPHVTLTLLLASAPGLSTSARICTWKALSAAASALARDCSACNCAAGTTRHAACSVEHVTCLTACAGPTQRTGMYSADRTDDHVPMTRPVPRTLTNVSVCVLRRSAACERWCAAAKAHELCGPRRRECRRSHSPCLDQ